MSLKNVCIDFWYFISTNITLSINCITFLKVSSEMKKLC